MFSEHYAHIWDIMLIYGTLNDTKKNPEDFRERAAKILVQ